MTSGERAEDRLSAFAWETAPLVLIVALFLASARLVEWRTGLPLSEDLWRLAWDGSRSAGIFTLLYVVPFLLAFGLSRPIYLLLKSEQRSAWSDYRRHLRADRILGIFLAFFLLYLVQRQFLDYKGSLSKLNPFAWDTAFLELDRWLHLGVDPWRLLQPLIGQPITTFLIDQLYFVWYLVNFVFFFLIAIRRPDELRQRFITSYFLLWILAGNGLAILFSSAGPVYYEQVTGLESPFVPLFTYLEAVDERFPLHALELQAALWADYNDATASGLEGISAMPSLHVATPVLLTIVAFKVRPWLGYVFGVYAFLILVGSVHLGWHYAVDGYLSILVTPLIWFGSRSMIRPFLNDSQRHPPTRGR